MGKKHAQQTLTLVAVDIEGAWNVPLLQASAEMNDAGLSFVHHALPPDQVAVDANATAPCDRGFLSQFDDVIACETGRRSQNVYEAVAPRGRTAVIVGNELRGLPRGVLSLASQHVWIPMSGAGLSSVNVAVAGAIALYALRKDFGRRPLQRSQQGRGRPDLLIRGADDPSDVGSLFRSVWAFGWKHVYLQDTGGVWFDVDRDTMIAGRAAARAEKNPLVISRSADLAVEGHDHVIVCDRDRSGAPLSRFHWPGCERPLVVYGPGDDAWPSSTPVTRVSVDAPGPRSPAGFRHDGSILLSVLAETLRGAHRG